MRLVELVENKTEALRVRDVAPILGVSIQQVIQNGRKWPDPVLQSCQLSAF